MKAKSKRGRRDSRSVPRDGWAWHNRNDLKVADDWPESCVWAGSNRHFSVLVYVIGPNRNTVRMTAERHGNVGRITWSDLQRIKEDILGCSVAAFEHYPPKVFEVRTTNMRHLWVTPLPLPGFGPRDGRGIQTSAFDGLAGSEIFSTMNGGHDEKSTGETSKEDGDPES